MSRKYLRPGLMYELINPITARVVILKNKIMLYFELLKKKTRKQPTFLEREDITPSRRTRSLCRQKLITYKLDVFTLNRTIVTSSSYITLT